MTIQHITQYLELIAPLAYQESYDNAGLIVGNPAIEVQKVLICLDSIESVIDEAIEKECQLIIAHHPIIFSGLKKITGNSYIERVIIKAIKHDIGIYACHTNLDNVLHYGVNQKIASKLELQNTKILDPKKGELKKLITFVPTSHKELVLESLFKAGAGHIGNYSHCSFTSIGKGSFMPSENTNPFVGQIGETHFEDEVKMEVILPKNKQPQIIRALLNSHPYEEVAYDIMALQNSYSQIGAGIIGELNSPLTPLDFFQLVKNQFYTSCIKHTELTTTQIKTVAVCGGSGSFLLDKAIQANADIFITADFKYHQFFDTNNNIIIADIGHYESEQFTIDLMEELLQKEFQNLNIVKTSINTNPVYYYS